MAKVLYCRFCGEQLPDRVTHCPVCGEPVYDPEWARRPYAPVGLKRGFHFGSIDWTPVFNVIILIVAVVVFIWALNTPLGKSIVGKVEGMFATPVDSGQAISAAPAQQPSESQRCLSSGGVLVTIGGKSECRTPTTAAPIQSPALSGLAPVQQPTAQPAPQELPTIQPTAPPPVGPANCSYPLDISLWQTGAQQASVYDRNNYIGYWLNDASPHRNPWEQWLHEHGGRDAVGSDLSGCSRIIALPESIAVTVPEQPAQPQSVTQPYQPPPPPPPTAAPQAQDDEAVKQLTWIMNNDPRPYAIAPQMAYMKFGTADEIIADLKRLAEVCKAGTPGELTKSNGPTTIVFTCENYNWEWFYK